MELNPDCLAYRSVANKRGVNYLFFEKGFNKLSIRQVKLRLGSLQGKNHNEIVCADSSDYHPFPESYGESFMPLARVVKNDNYLESDDFKEKERVYRKSHKRFN